MWLKIDQTILDSELKSRPGGIINTIRPDGVSALKTDIADISAGLSATRDLKTEIAQTSGATPPIQGQPMKGRNTLGEVQSSITEGSYRIIDMMHNVENYYLYPDLKMSHSLNQQYIEKKVIVRMKKKRKVKLSDGQEIEVANMPYVLYKEDIKFPFEFTIHVATQVENRIIKNQAMLNYIESLQKSGLPPEIVGLPIYRLLKQVWVNLQLGEVETVFPKDLENQIYAMSGKPPPGTQPNPETAEKKLTGEVRGKSTGGEKGGTGAI